MASVMAATISRFCWSVRPAYHWTVMLGMEGPPDRALFQTPQVVGEIGGEGVGLDGAVGVEAHDEILADLGARVALPVEPSPDRVTVVEADLVRLSQRALERRRVRLARRDRSRLGRGEVAAEPDRDTTGQYEGERDETRHPPGPSHGAEYERNHANSQGCVEEVCELARGAT